MYIAYQFETDVVCPKLPHCIVIRMIDSKWSSRWAWERLQELVGKAKTCCYRLTQVIRNHKWESEPGMIYGTKDGGKYGNGVVSVQYFRSENELRGDSLPA